MYKVKVGHAHLRVRNLQKSIEFYSRTLGMRVTETVGGQYAFLTAGTMHHELALQAVGDDAPAQLQTAPGLYHIAFEVADKAELAAAYRTIKHSGIPVVSVDHVISWAIYFADPDGNGLEIYCDTRTEREAPLWRGKNEALPETELLKFEPQRQTPRGVPNKQSAVNNPDKEQGE